MQTLLEFATEKMLTTLLVKERAKCRRRNHHEKNHTLDKVCDIEELSTRKMLSRMMPPRYAWLRPSKRKRSTLDNGAVDTSKNAEKALLLTINRDRKLRNQGGTFSYLDELDKFIDKIRKRLESSNLTFEPPKLFPILKSKEPMGDGSFLVVCRPLSTYTRLEDKIILALATRYLSCYFNRFLHENILSYRPARTFHNKTHYVTDFNDGIELIKNYRDSREHDSIYVGDCDIKKFYDIIPHQTVRDCFSRLMDQSDISPSGKKQLMNVLEAYLNSYNFYENAWVEAKTHDEAYFKVRRRLHDREKRNTYRLGWIDEVMELPEEQRRKIGIPQGGSLSLMIANVVLNDVDMALLSYPDPNRLLIRYCDDMILLHTDYNECCRLMKVYTESLRNHGLYFHNFENVCDSKCVTVGSDKAIGTTSHFWKIKSHKPFLWDDGAGNCNRYIGFLGFEIRRDGRIRLRKSNIAKFKEKLIRHFYALHRYKKNHSDEEFSEHIQHVFKTVLDGVNFYKALDLNVFKNKCQYAYMKKLVQKTAKRLHYKGDLN